MRSRWVACVALALAAPVLVGCMTFSAGTASSTTPLPPDVKYTVKEEDVTASAWGIYVLGFPLAEPRQTKSARDRALAQADADALIDCAVDTNLYNLIFVLITRTTVNGTAVDITR